MELCEAVRVTLTPTHYRVQLVDGLGDWQRAVVAATGVLTDGEAARPRDAGEGQVAADGQLFEQIRASLLAAHAAAAELHAQTRRRTVIYGAERADVYWSSRRATLLLHVPAAALAAPAGPRSADAAPSLSVLKGNVPPRLQAAVREAPAGPGAITALCNLVEREFERL